MRMTNAWTEIAQKNERLRFMSLILSITTLALSVSTFLLGVRDPVLVERGCRSQIIHPVNSERTASEIESFIREALLDRFDTAEGVTSRFLNDEEFSLKNQEQKEFAQKGIRQKILIESVKVTPDRIIIDADRIFSVGAVKSVLPLSLEAHVVTVRRTDVNPYGLVISKVSPQQKIDK